MRLEANTEIQTSGDRKASSGGRTGHADPVLTNTYADTREVSPPASDGRLHVLHLSRLSAELVSIGLMCNSLVSMPALGIVEPRQTRLVGV